MPDIDVKLALIRIVMSFFVAAAMRYLTWGLMHEKPNEAEREYHSIFTGCAAAMVAVVLLLIGG